MLKQFIPIIVVISILSVVYYVNLSKVSEVGDEHCYLTSSSCKIAIQDEQLEIVFSAYPVLIEEWNSLAMYVPQQYFVDKIWIEGSNMFMGKTPVIIEESVDGISDYLRGEFFLGACSEPEMRWRMVIRLQQKSSGESILRTLYFQTQFES